MGPSRSIRRRASRRFHGCAIDYRGPEGDVLEVVFAPNEDISERVIFPITEAQSNGIEDARFVEFNDDGKKRSTQHTPPMAAAAIRSELIETTDFLSFRMSPLSGTATRNKGMALFPEKIDGQVRDDRPPGQ